MKKLFSILISITIIPFISSFDGYTVYEDDEIIENEIIESMGLINDYSLSCEVGTKLIHIKMGTYGSGTMSEIGFKNILIERSDNGSYWSTEKTISSVILTIYPGNNGGWYFASVTITNASSYYISDYTASVLGGHYYRVTLDHYARIGTDIETFNTTSNYIWIA